MTAAPAAPRRKAPPPLRDLRPPKLKLPPGACDTHFHFLGPQSAYPFNPGRKFVPDVDHEDSTIADWQAMQKALGLSRGLLVQSMMYYPSYELALHGLSLMPDRLRGVVYPAPSLTDRELALLTRAGVVGARFTTPTGPGISTTGWCGASTSSAGACITCSTARIMSRPGASRSSPRPASS